MASKGGILDVKHIRINRLRYWFCHRRFCRVQIIKEDMEKMSDINFISPLHNSQSRATMINQLVIFICIEFANDKDVGFIRKKFESVDSNTVRNLYKILMMIRQKSSSDSIKKLSYQFIQNFYLYYL